MLLAWLGSARLGSAWLGLAWLFIALCFALLRFLFHCLLACLPACLLAVWQAGLTSSSLARMNRIHAASAFIGFGPCQLAWSFLEVPLKSAALQDQPFCGSSRTGASHQGIVVFGLCQNQIRITALATSLQDSTWFLQRQVGGCQNQSLFLCLCKMYISDLCAAFEEGLVCVASSLSLPQRCHPSPRSEFTGRASFPVSGRRNGSARPGIDPRQRLDVLDEVSGIHRRTYD